MIGEKSIARTTEKRGRIPTTRDRVELLLCRWLMQAALLALKLRPQGARP